jgi:HSP20 family protein
LLDGVRVQIIVNIKIRKIMNHVRFNRFPFQAAFDHLITEAIDQIATPARNTSRPAANIVETEKGYEVELAIPGFSKTDVKINLDKQILTISGAKEQIAEAEKTQFKHREFVTRSFERSFQLPEGVDQNEITASFNEGILRVVLPKLADLLVEPKTISIN